MLKPESAVQNQHKLVTLLLSSLPTLSQMPAGEQPVVREPRAGALGGKVRGLGGETQGVGPVSSAPEGCYGGEGETHSKGIPWDRSRTNGTC